jgi:hypothetical protein
MAWRCAANSDIPVRILDYGGGIEPTTATSAGCVTSTRAARPRSRWTQNERLYGNVVRALAG